MTPLALVLIRCCRSTSWTPRAGQELNLTLLVSASTACRSVVHCDGDRDHVDVQCSRETVGEGVGTDLDVRQSGKSREGAYGGLGNRIDLANVDSVTTYNCINTFRIKLGAPLSILDYNGDGVPGDQADMSQGGQ